MPVMTAAPRSFGGIRRGILDQRSRNLGPVLVLGGGSRISSRRRAHPLVRAPVGADNYSMSKKIIAIAIALAFALIFALVAMVTPSTGQTNYREPDGLFVGLVVLRCNKFLDLFVQRTPDAWRWGR